MRTSLEFPDPLFRQLKAQAALEGTSLRDLVLRLIDRGMSAPAAPSGSSQDERAFLPSVRLGAPMTLSADQFTNANLSAFLDE